VEGDGPSALALILILVALVNVFVVCFCALVLACDAVRRRAEGLRYAAVAPRAERRR
jgi:hypothetical protein